MPDNKLHRIVHAGDPVFTMRHECLDCGEACFDCDEPPCEVGPLKDFNDEDEGLVRLCDGCHKAWTEAQEGSN